MSKIILASSSPRRKELLKKAGIDFIIDASSIDEVMDESLPLEERLMKLATDKIINIHYKYSQDIVIGADTVVCFQNQIIGKAKDENHAREILKTLSNHKHTVYTAVAIYFQDELMTFVDHTDVYFKDISDMIEEYIASQDWVGKAGAYGIQGSADKFVDHIEGDKDTVIGLPVQSLVKILLNRK